MSGCASDKTLHSKYNNDIILLTGAGASGYLGLPTLDHIVNNLSLSLTDENIVSLIRKTRRAIEGNIHRVSSAVFEELIAKLKYYLQVTETLARDTTYTGEIGPLPHEINTGVFARKWKRALTECYRLLIAEYGPHKINFETTECKAMVDLLAALSHFNSGELHVYTTNYDCSYQVIASHCQALSFFSHIDNQIGTFKDSWFTVRPELAALELPQIYIHRLHGCVAWFAQEEPYQIFEVYGAGGALNLDDDDLLHKMCIKLITSQEIGENIAFLSAYEEFSAHLKSAKALIIWGSSFRDTEVLRAINNAFAVRNSPLPIYYINPFRSEDMVITNIRKTLRPVPVVIAPEFVPRQIKWLPQQPGEMLINAVMGVLTKEVLNQ